MAQMCKVREAISAHHRKQVSVQFWEKLKILSRWIWGIAWKDVEGPELQFMTADRNSTKDLHSLMYSTYLGPQAFLKLLQTRPTRSMVS